MDSNSSRENVEMPCRSWQYRSYRGSCISASRPLRAAENSYATGKRRGKVRTRAFAARGTRVDGDIFPLVVPLVDGWRSPTRGCGAERGVATHLERLRLEGLLQRIFVRASKLAHALALEELHRGRAAWSARRARVVARVTFKTTVCLKRPTP
jgi:hypothetical protein